MIHFVQDLSSVKIHKTSKKNFFFQLFISFEKRNFLVFILLLFPIGKICNENQRKKIFVLFELCGNQKKIIRGKFINNNYDLLIDFILKVFKIHVNRLYESRLIALAEGFW